MTAPVTAMDAARIAATRQRLPRAFGRPLGERLWIWGWWLGFAPLTVYCLWRFEFAPQRLWMGMHELGVIVVQLFPPSPGDEPREIFWSLLETVAMAFLGTLLAALISMPLAFLAAKNTFPFRLPRFGIRRLLDCLRGVDQLIWALIFVRAVGLGPLAGIMAIFISDTGTLSKLFSELFENVERKPAEGVRAAARPHSDPALRRVAAGDADVPVEHALHFRVERALRHHPRHRRRRRDRVSIVGPHPRAQLGRGLLHLDPDFAITVAGIDWVSKHLRMWLIGQQA